MIRFSKLIHSIELIVCELSKTGKKETAIFFISKLEVLKNTNLPLEEKIKIASELSKCAPMGQYGNFSFVEENILEQVINNASEELKY